MIRKSGGAAVTGVAAIEAEPSLSHADPAKSRPKVARGRERESALAMSTREVDAFLSRQDYPLYVVTTQAAGHRDGCLVGFATQTSLDPVRLLVCLSRANATTRTAELASHLAVHQLADSQHELARLFAEESGDWTDKFSRCDWRPGPHDLPLLDSCAAWLVGRVLERLDLGDHIGFLLEPTAAQTRTEAGLLMLKGLPPVEAGHPA
jgi:flavin reductase (DIM6/NTAB) family NADH-FMN oxidoreductase RutF